MDEMKLKDISFERAIGKMYPKFYQHVKQFGYGMIVFPKLVRELKGNYFLVRNVIIDESDGTNIIDKKSEVTGKF